MKNILTTVATATLFTGLTLSTAAAGVTAGSSILCFDGNASDTALDRNISIDVKNQGTDVNLTLIPAAVYQGASFKLKFENGGLSNNDTQLLCVGDTKVGGLQEPGALNGTIMTEPTFSFIDNDSVADIIAKDSNISLRTTTDCNLSVAGASDKLKVIGLADKPCQTVSAKIINGKSTQGNDIPSIVTNTATFGDTIQYIKISCTVPVCHVTSDGMQFTEDLSVAGVNVALSDRTPTPPVHFINEASCPSCDEATVAAVNTTPCVTYITIKNTATTDDLNITGLDIVTTFVPADGESSTFLPTIKMFINEDNTTVPAVDVTLGQKISPSDLHIAAGDTAVIKLALLSKNTESIALGTLKATIDGFDTNISGEVGNITFANQSLVDITKGATTDFTVPYMSSASASKVNFVRISTLLGDSSTTLSAIISDEEGHTCSVNYPDIPGNGGSIQIFASKVPAIGNNHPLFGTEGCPTLTSKFYSVKFSAGASVNAVGYMRTKGGERTIDIF